LLTASSHGGVEMKKALASITVIFLLVGAVGCSNWNRYTPKAWDSTAIAEEIRKNMLGDGITGMTVDVDNNGVVTLKGDVKTTSDRQKAVDDARKVKGVTRVVDHIAIKP
jgi:BON domain